MEKNGISVVVPMLNSERYIEKCVMSILAQGSVVKEVICVDNGSEDSTKDIVARMQKSDRRIKIFLCKQKGVSAARNFGMQQVSGKYILFVDSDDYLKNKKLHKLYKKAVKADADILVFGGTSTEPLKAPHWVRRVLSPQKRICRMEECDNIFALRGVLPATWNKLYRAEVLEGLAFSEQLRIAEDKLFQFCAFMCAEQVVFVKDRIYVYRVNADSVMSRADKREKEEQHILAMQLAEHWLDERNPDPEMLNCLKNFRETFSEQEVVQGRFRKYMFYIRNYGFRSFVEFGLGQIFHK